MAKFIDSTNLGYLISKIKAAFWPKTDVTNVTLVDVAVTGDYDDLINKPVVDSTPTASSTNLVTSGGVASALSGMEIASNKVTAISSLSTDTQYPSAKCVYDALASAQGTPKATTIPSGGMLPNVYYALGTLTGSVSLTMASPTESGILNQYFFTFDTGATAPTITWSNLITSWYGGSAPTINSGKHYEVSVVDGVGVCMEV